MSLWRFSVFLDNFGELLPVLRHREFVDADGLDGVQEVLLGGRVQAGLALHLEQTTAKCSRHGSTWQ